jgi:ABC-type transporter Mla subunit MlaD
VLQESGARVRDLQEAAVAFRSVATEASTLTRELRGTSELQRKAIEGTTTMVASVSDVVREQAMVADKTRDSFAVAGKMLGSLDTDLARALQAVVEGMQQYNVQVERNFESIIGKVNREMPALFERLEQSLAQVSSAVEDLNDMLARQQGRQT